MPRQLKTRKKSLRPNKVVDFIIEDDIFNKLLHVFVGKYEDVVKYFNKKKYYPPLLGENVFQKNYGGLFIQLEAPDNDTANILWLSEYREGYLSHECMHATHTFLKQNDIKLSDETQEVYAYYMGFLTKSIRKELNKRKYYENTNY